MTMTSIATTGTSLGRSSLRGPLRTAILAVAVVAVVAFAATGWFGVSWYRAAHGKSLAVGVDRDAVLADAQRAMVTLNTLAYRRVQDGLTLWEQSTTGSLPSQLRANRDAYAPALTASTAVTTATVPRPAGRPPNER